MALLSDLVAICANQRLDSEATLNLFSRRLREAGRVSKAGRGRGAAKMTYLDGARFLIACAATDHPERVADAEAVFSSTMLTDRGTDGAFAPADRAPLDQVLAQVLERISDGSIDTENQEVADAKGLKITMPAILEFNVFRSGVSASIRAGRDTFVFHHPAMAEMITAPHHDIVETLEKSYLRETERFRSGKNLHAQLNGELLRAIASAIAGESAAK